MCVQNSISKDILKIQAKLATYKVGSRNYDKYTKILSKHTKQVSMHRRVVSSINSIDVVKQLSGY
jgi:hypothetical protein